MQPVESKSYLELEFEKLDKEFEEAFDMSTQHSWSQAEWYRYDRHLDSVRSRKGQLESAYNRGLLKSVMEILLETNEQQRLEIAQPFLDFLDAVTIADITGLSVEQIEKLKTHEQPEEEKEAKI